MKKVFAFIGVFSFLLAGCHVPTTLSETEQLPSVPDFLTDEQQKLYLGAYSLYEQLFGPDACEAEMSPASDRLIIDGLSYAEIGGEYSSPEVFYSSIHPFFTETCWSEINEPQYGVEVYTERNGKMYAAVNDNISVSAIRNSGSYYNENFPDEFRLIEQTDSTVDFVLIGHYSQPKINESIQALQERKLTGYDYTLELPVRLLLTEDGWRFDKFSMARFDEDALEYRPFAFQYADTLQLHGKTVHAAIDIQSKKEDASQYQLQITVLDSPCDIHIQDTLSRPGFCPETVNSGYIFADLNGDENDDILIDLGVQNYYRYYDCYVYCPDNNGYTKIEEFSTLPDPEFINGSIISHWKDGPAISGTTKYQITDSELHMVGRLTRSYVLDNGEIPRFTEELMVDGQMTVVKENVLAEEIDELES